MELVYLKNVSYNNLKDIDFDLSTNNTIFGKNLKVTAIAGENGSGKSSLLNYIYKFSQMSYYEYKKPDENTHGGSDILIYKDNNGELIVKGDRYGLYISEYPDANFDDKPLNCSLIEYDNTVKNGHSIIKENKIFKLIKILLKKNDILKYFDEEFIFKKFKIKLNRQNINHFDENKHSYSSLFLNIKNRIIELIKSNAEDIKTESELDKLMFSTKVIEYEMKIAYIISYLHELQDRFTDQSVSNEDFLKKEENHFNEMTFENMFDLVEKFDIKINKSDIFNIYSEKEILAIKKLIKIFQYQDSNASDKITMQSKLIIDKEFYHDYETSLTLNIESDEKVVIDILDTIENELVFFSFSKLLDFELYSYDNNVVFSELSSGEQNLIHKYMLMLHEILFNKSDIILLDEPDILLHPNWAKSFLKKLIDIITNDSILKEEKLHICISTHSPFILSDLPKENIIFLEKGKQVYPFKNNEQTFGANIHTLLSHGFFMEDGLMGEFAKDRINKAIKYLNQKNLSKDEIDYCENIISIIGEPILKRQLQKILDSKGLVKVDEIAKLEEEINLLKHRIDILRKNK